MPKAILIFGCAAALVLIACGRQGDFANPAPVGAAKVPAAKPTHANVDERRLLTADEQPGQWMSTGRDYNEQRFSPLTKINDKNVSQLGLAWFGEFDTRRGQESTPLVIDGVLYVTTAWSKVYAYDAKTGRSCGSSIRKCQASGA